MNTIHSRSQDESEIRTMVEDWAAAVRRRDITGILQDHSADIMMFDVPPPFKSNGIEAYKQTWDLFFSCSGDPVVFDIDSLTVTAGGDVAFVVATMHCTEPEPNGTRRPLNFRLTTGLRKMNGRWTITHEHHSVPAED